MTPRATRAKYSCMSSTHIRSFAERLNRAGCTGPHIGSLTIVRQHLFEPAWKALSSLDLLDAQEYINTASVERKSALNPTTGVRPSRAIGCESIHRLQRVRLLSLVTMGRSIVQRSAKGSQIRVAACVCHDDGMRTVISRSSADLAWFWSARL